MAATIVAENPLELVNPRGSSDDDWGIRPRRLIAETTINLDEVTGSGRGLLIGTRMVLNELMRGFGLTESPQIAPDGSLRFPYFRDGLAASRPALEEVGIPIIDEVL